MSEATVNPDGTTTFEDATAGAGETFEEAAEDAFEGAEEAAEEIVKGTDPAIYLALAFIVVVALYVINYKRNQRKQAEREAFFMDMDGDKVRFRKNLH